MTVNIKTIHIISVILILIIILFKLIFVVGFEKIWYTIRV